MRIVFFGASKFVLPILEILRKNFDLTLVLTTEKLPTESVPSYCEKNNIPYLSVRDFSGSNLKSKIINLKSPLAVLAYFGLILPKDVLDLFPKGILNVHPSLLPKYRGPTPGQTVILNGDQITGVTIIKLDEEVDHGPILVSEKEHILTTDTAETLYEWLFKKGADLLYNSIEPYLKGKLQPKEQNHSKATFTEHLSRQSGYIDPSLLKIENSKLKIERSIRAYHPWPGVWTRLRLNNKERVVKLLPEQKLQVEGKKPMSYKDFLNGYPEANGFVQKILA